MDRSSGWGGMLPGAVWSWIWLWLGIVSMGAGCVPQPEKEVVLYTSVDRQYAAPLLDAFERRRPEITITRQFDVEASKTLGLVTRLMEEQKNPRCDLFWNGEILHTIRLQRAGMLQARRWKIPAGWKTGYLASDGSWIGFAPRARVLLVHTKSIPDAKERPSRVSDLADPKWKGKCAVAFPMFGTTATHFAVLASRMGDQADAFLQQVAANALVLSGNKQVADAVASGQVAFGLTDTDDAQVAKEQGAPVEIIFPDQPTGSDDQEAIGTLFIPGTVAILKNAPHPIAAQWLADALIDQETEKRLTMALGSQFPIWPSSEKSSSSSPIASLRWMEVDFERAADGWEPLAAKLRRWFAPGANSKGAGSAEGSATIPAEDSQP